MKPNINLAVNKISCFIDCVEHNIIYVRFASRTPVQNAFTLKGLQQFFNYLRFLVARIAASRIRFLAIGRVITFSF